MAPVALRQLGVMLWKNWLIRKRNRLTTFFELFFPLFSVAVAIGLNSIQYEGRMNVIKEGPFLYPDPVAEYGANLSAFPPEITNQIQSRQSLPDTSDLPDITKLNKTMEDEIRKVRPLFVGFYTEVYLWPKSSFTERMADGLRKLLLLSTVDIKKLANSTMNMDTAVDLRLTKLIVLDDEAAFRHILSVDAVRKENQLIGVGFNVKADDANSKPSTPSENSTIRSRATPAIEFYFRETKKETVPESNFEYKFVTPNCHDSYHLDEQYQFEPDQRPYNKTPYTHCFIVPLQIGVNEAYLNLLAEQRGKKRQYFDYVRLQKLPYPRYMTTDKPQSFGPLTLISFTLALFQLVMPIMIVTRVTAEKQSHLRELFRMMGMSDGVFWLSHFLNYFVFVLLQSLVMTILYRLPIAGHPMIAYSHIGTFFLAMVLWGTANILLSFVIAIVCFRSAIAIVVVIIVWEVTFSLPNVLLNPIMGKTSGSLEPYRILVSFVPNMAITWLLQLMGEKEKFGQGIKWNTMFEPVTIFGNLTFGLVLVFLAVTCLFLVFLVWYLDNVWPWQEGIHKPFYFFLMPSYWRPRQGLHAESAPIDTGAVDSNYFEDEPDYEVGISLRNVRKTFGSKTVVESVSLNCYKGQITVLLGHNGAGKTTTMNIITGIFPATKGTAFVDGYNVITQTRQARKSLGLCPQINIFYNKLTIFEHFRLFAVLRGKTFSEAKVEAEKVIDMLQLTKKRDTLAQNLSGGMKRRVCLGNALIGDTRILVLDEPSSGMDPEARRAVWDLLLRIRENKTILITTHHMEEADVLGNRIAIMASGRVICCGTPLFLKREFGVGSHLRMAVNERFRLQTVRDLLKQHLERVTIETESPDEVVWLIHADGNKQDKSNLIQLFEDLERNKEELGITAFGMEVTTMEEVFLKVGEVVASRSNETDSVGSRFNKAVALEKPFKKLTGCRLWLHRVWALLAKRVHYIKRSWPILIFQLFLPIILFSIIFYLDKMARGFQAKDVVRQMDFDSIYRTKKTWFNLRGLLSKERPLQGFYAGEPDLADFYQKAAEREGSIVKRIAVGNENAYMLNVTDDLDIYKRKNIFGATAHRPPQSNLLRNLTIWFQNDAFHSLPASINLAYKALQNQILGFPDHGTITFWFNSVPRSDLDSYAKSITVGWFITSFILLPLCVSFVMASYTMFVIHENATKVCTDLQLLKYLKPNYTYTCLLCTCIYCNPV